MHWMKLVAFVLALAALIAGTASVGTALGATETVSLGFNEDTGPEPGPFLDPPAVEDPLSFKVTYTATPVQPLEILQSLYCDRGATGIPEKKETVTPPITTTLTAPTGSDSCSLEVSAETPVATTVFGTVRIEAEAIRTLKTQSTPPSTPKKKCKKGKELRHGKCVKKGQKKHPHKRSPGAATSARFGG
jgi:hypothetical protein